MSATRFWLWLSTKEKVNLRRLNKALAWFGTPELVYKADERSLKYVEGLKGTDINALMDKDMSQAEAIISQCAQKGIAIITMQDASYPGLLRNLEDPPLVLYVKGTMPDMETELPIAVVGSRTCSAYGLLAAKRLGYQISRCGGLVVSGMAKGIDGMAQQGALLAGCRTVAVLGCGVDIIYPMANKRLYEDIVAHGAVISEYPPGTPPKKMHFPARNRLISGMCRAVVVAECGQNSGALITARHALDQGRDVFAVPGNIDNANCAGSNALIQEGAGLVTSGWDVVGEYAYLRPGKVKYQRDAVSIHLDSTVPLPVEPEPEPETEPAASPQVREEPETQAEAEPKTQQKKAKKSQPKKEKSSSQRKKVIDKEADKAYIQRLKELNPDEMAIVSAIGGKSRHIDDIIDLTQLRAARVLACLTLLELQGIVIRGNGKRYSLAGPPPGQ